MTALRTTEVGGLLTISHASTAPSTAPMIAVLADSSTLFHNADSAVSENNAAIRSSEKTPSSKTALTITVTVGTIRKIVTSAKNGSSGSASRTVGHGARTSADGLGPVVRQILGGLVGLVGRRHGDRAVDDRDLVDRGLVDGARLQHRRRPAPGRTPPAA